MELSSIEISHIVLGLQLSMAVVFSHRKQSEFLYTLPSVRVGRTNCPWLRATGIVWLLAFSTLAKLFNTKVVRSMLL